MPASWPDFDVPSVCPICRAQHEAMANMTDQGPPDDGALNLCIVCHGISIFDSSVPTKLRFPTDEELVEIRADPEVARVLAAMEMAKMLSGPLKGDYFPDR